MSFIPLSPDEITKLRELLTDETAAEIANVEGFSGDWLDQVHVLCDMAEASLALPSPCGHSSQYAYSEDSGKHIVCLLCERSAVTEARRGEVIEECARLCDLIGYDWRDSGNQLKQYAAEYLAAQIRDKTKRTDMNNGEAGK